MKFRLITRNVLLPASQRQATENRMHIVTSLVDRERVHRCVLQRPRVVVRDYLGKRSPCGDDPVVREGIVRRATRIDARLLYIN